MCRKLEVTPPPPWEQIIFHLPVSEPPVHILLLGQSESTGAAQCKRIKADEGVPSNDCRMGLRPANGRGPPTVATGKCSLAVISLVTGHGSPVSLLGQEERGGRSLQLSVNNKDLFTLNRTGLNA